MASSRAERLPREHHSRVERALRVVYGAVLPAILRRSSPGWGPGPMSKERSWDFFVSLAVELGEWAPRLAAGQDPVDTMRRVERAHREEAAGELVTLVRRMSPPVRTVVEARACGVPWKRMTERMPDRAYFSLVDDYRRATATLHADYEDLIRRLL